MSCNPLRSLVAADSDARRSRSAEGLYQKGQSWAQKKQGRLDELAKKVREEEQVRATALAGGSVAPPHYRVTAGKSGRDVEEDEENHRLAQRWGLSGPCAGRVSAADAAAKPLL